MAPRKESPAERSLPHSFEAERSVLGAVLVHNEALDTVAALLRPEYFFREAHKRIYAAFLKLYENSQAIDLVTLNEQLLKTGDADEVGGPAYIAALTDGVPRSTNVEHYAKIIVERWQLRSAIFIANKLASRAYDAEDEDPTQIAGRAADELFQLGGSVAGKAVPLADIMNDAILDIERASASGSTVTGLATGFTDLDEMTSGFQPDDLDIVAARTSVGKTSFALNIARNVAGIGAGVVLIHSLEMGKKLLFLRLLAAESHVDFQRLRRGRLSEREWTQVSNALGRLQQLPIYIDDTPGVGVIDVRMRARALRAQAALALIIVDYLQLMHGHGKFDSRQQEIGTITRGLKAISRELQVPSVVLSQLNRAPEQRRSKKPQLSDLRESGDIENDADTVLLLYRPDDGPDDVADVDVAKQRNGPTGPVKLRFIKSCMRFENLAQTDVPA